MIMENKGRGPMVSLRKQKMVRRKKDWQANSKKSGLAHEI